MLTNIKGTSVNPEAKIGEPRMTGYGLRVLPVKEQKRPATKRKNSNNDEVEEEDDSCKTITQQIGKCFLPNISIPLRRGKDRDPEPIYECSGADAVASIQFFNRNILLSRKLILRALPQAIDDFTTAKGENGNLLYEAKHVPDIDQSFIG